MITAPTLEIIVLLLGLLVLMVEAFTAPEMRRKLLWGSIAVLVLVFAATFYLAPAAPGAMKSPFWQFYTADTLAIFFKRFALLTTILVLVMMSDYAKVAARFFPTFKGQPSTGEFFALPIFTCAGLMYMASAIDFIMIFVSLELVTISFYVLVTFTRRNPLTLEAGLKYLILSALSTGFLVYGITWIFGATGETNLNQIAAVFSTGRFEMGAALLGISLVIVALGFKIAAVPFQIWVPDVYQGAPTPITAFLSVGSKAAGFVVLLRVLQPFMMLPKVNKLIAGLALLTLLYGNLAALPQTNLKRLLGYSSIAHAGYLLIGVTCLDGRAVAFYLVSYLLMTMLSFIVLSAVAEHTGGEMSDFAGLSRRSPFLSFAMLIAMASLAGIPFTAGFLGKFLIFFGAVEQNRTALVVVGVFTVACGFYYYLKVVRAMYWQETEVSSPIAVSGLSRLTICGLIVAIVVFGVYPQPILRPFTQPAQKIAATRK